MSTTQSPEATPDSPATCNAEDLPEERSVRSRIETTCGGTTLDVEVEIGLLHLKGTDGKPTAAIFHTSYVVDSADTKRPVTFCFNGGPGSSSVWLHMGAFGPRRIVLPDPQHGGPPPHTLVDNDRGLLDLTDLVFIDPVGTGFSTAPDADKAAAFHTVDQDVASVGMFITRWLSANGRWASPRFLSGESYGTTRSAALAEWLETRGVALNGLVLLSLAIQFQTFIPDRANQLPYQTFLPTFAATAAYHGRIPLPEGGLDALLAEARRFATEVYGPALHRGDELDEAALIEVSEGLAALTGLPAEAIAARQLRIEAMWFSKQLLAPSGLCVGRLDGRYLGRDGKPDHALMQRDPAYDASLGPYTALANAHLRDTLGWDTDRPYEVLSMEVNSHWDWRQQGQLGFPDTSGQLHTAMTANPHLKVLFANGLYDLATPFAAAEYTARHLRLPAESRSNVRLTYYEAGHMMYFHDPSLTQLRADLEAFYGWALSSGA